MRTWWTFLKRFYGPWWTAFIAMYTLYALFRTEIAPAQAASKLPVLRDVLSFGPWWVWVLLGPAVFALITLGLAFRLVRQIDLDLKLQELLPVSAALPVKEPKAHEVEGSLLRVRVFNRGLEGSFRAQVCYVANAELINSPPWFTSWANSSEQDLFIAGDGSHADLNLISALPLTVAKSGWAVRPVFPTGTTQAYKDINEVDLRVLVTKVGVRGSRLFGVKLDLHAGQPRATLDDLVLPG